jgi:hypothetical protein
LSEVSIIGGGPAGSAAAIAALQASSKVRLIEKSRFPRHKVCGEFLSPEIGVVLDRLGVWSEFLASEPSLIRHLSLHFRKSEKKCRLPEAAYGLSRYRFDKLLFDEAVRLGARVATEIHDPERRPLIVAHGRRASLPRGKRLFGFKAHFEGPVNDAVELFFFSGCYVGVSAVEGGVTNVCGLGPENILTARNFDIDAVVHSFPPLAERLGPLSRKFKWLSVGPLQFRNSFRSALPEGHYPAGDALSFVDPFTGSGLLAAVTTGSLAGAAAARGTSTREYLAECRRCLANSYRISSVFRATLGSGWAEMLVPFVPGQWLVRWTRPQVG